MTLSAYYDDECVVNGLRAFFDVEEQWVIDFEGLLSQIEDVSDDFYELKIKDRKFRIHKITGDVEEVKT